jgi:hypothetical protein
VVIGKNACEVLSAAAPRKVEDIETTVAQKSIFNQFVLPKLK